MIDSCGSVHSELLPGYHINRSVYQRQKQYAPKKSTVIGQGITPYRELNTFLPPPLTR